jgi:glc operon protein GlcG
MLIRKTTKLTHRGVQKMLDAAVAEADGIGVHINVVIVDESGVDLGMLRMDGAKFLSVETARAKARTAASHRVPTTEINSQIADALALASHGAITRMAGGLPIFVDGVCVGGIGIGSASDGDDIQIAHAGLRGLGT